MNTTAYILVEKSEKISYTFGKKKTICPSPFWGLYLDFCHCIVLVKTGSRLQWVFFLVLFPRACRTEQNRTKLYLAKLRPYIWRKSTMHATYMNKGTKDKIIYRIQGLKLTVAGSKFAAWKFSLLPGQAVGSKKLPPGKVLRTLSTLSVVNVFSANTF